MRVLKVRYLALVCLVVMVCLAMRLLCTPLAFQGHTGSVSSIWSTSDGKTLTSVSNDDKTIRLWDVATRKERAIFRGQTGVFVAFSPDCSVLASARLHDKVIRLWDLASGNERSVLQGHTGDVSSFAFSPDGNTLASASYDKTVKLWDVATGLERTILHGHTNLVEIVTFSPDGKILASGSMDHTVKLWDVATGKERATLKGLEQSVTGMAFHPEGNVPPCSPGADPPLACSLGGSTVRPAVSGVRAVCNGSLPTQRSAADGQMLSLSGDAVPAG